MKDVLSVVTFAMGALCFAIFLLTMKPDGLISVKAPRKPAQCKMPASLSPACRTEPERSGALRTSLQQRLC